MEPVINLIEAVKKHPLLYDPFHDDFKNLETKQKIWEEIGAEFDENAEEIKKQWKNLMDFYTKYLQSLSSNSSEFYTNCEWAQHMHVFRPFITSTCIADPPNSVSLVPQLDAVKTEIEIFDEICPADRGLQDEPPKISSNLKPTERKKQNSWSRSDHIDLIFSRYAETVKAFSPRMQVVAKLKLAQVMSELELENEEEEVASMSSRALTPPESSPRRPGKFLAGKSIRKRNRRATSLRKLLFMLEDIDEI